MCCLFFGKLFKQKKQDKKSCKICTNVYENDIIIDNICLKCEILNYPKRFNGCGFCKRPIKKPFCTICTNGFIEWLKNYIIPIDNQENKFDGIVKDMLITHAKINNEFIIRENDSLYYWSGFFAGFDANSSLEYRQPNYTKQSKKINFQYEPFIKTDYYEQTPVWIIPKIQRFTFSGGDKLTTKTSILTILQNHNINLFDDVQITKPFNNYEIEKINNYDTRVIKIANM